MILAENQESIEAFSFYRAGTPFGDSVLIRPPRPNADRLDTFRLEYLAEVGGKGEINSFLWRFCL